VSIVVMSSDKRAWSAERDAIRYDAKSPRSDRHVIVNASVTDLNASPFRTPVKIGTDSPLPLGADTWTPMPAPRESRRPATMPTIDAHVSTQIELDRESTQVEYESESWSGQ
jgi:hypothetical protein